MRDDVIDVTTLAESFDVMCSGKISRCFVMLPCRLILMCQDSGKCFNAVSCMLNYSSSLMLKCRVWPGAYTPFRFSASSEPSQCSGTLRCDSIVADIMQILLGGVVFGSGLPPV